ncbi:MAG: DUF2863 family protein [Betaproteobacteria bacterium]|nr:DUF2863 family protein [Betaproteobacteria bacterium]
MKRPRSKSPARLTPEAERLVSLALGLAASGSRAEDRFWELQISQSVARLLDHGHENAINTALDHLFQTHLPGYDTLMDLVEAAAETVTLDKDGEAWDVLLIAAPIVAWSKYSIPSGALSAPAAAALSAHLQAHVMAGGTRFALLPYLYSIDQMPRHFADVRKLAKKLGQAAISGNESKLETTQYPETANLLADSRFLLAAVAVPAGQPLFRWQEVGQNSHASRATCLEQWIAQGRPNLTPALTGCVFECLLPEAYFVACREADRAVRPYGIRAASAFLEGALKLPASQLTAVVGGFGTEQVDEYRIGFLPKGDDDVVYGIVWPLFGREDESGTPGPLDAIRAQFKESGIVDVIELDGLMTPEFCDDCGAPLFPDREGETQHAELPEESEQPAAHFH